jgi:glycosyltransferase involved in cell wall biosynthesis
MTEKNILCSVIIPEYNCPVEVAERCFLCFERYRDSLELIVVDDGSKEPYRSDIAKLVGGMSFIHIFYQEHKGVSAARNRGMKKANGRYVVFCDIDDTVDADAMMSAICHISEETDLLYCDYDKVRSGKKKRVGFASVPTGAMLMKNPTIHGTVWGKIYRREILKDVSFNETLTFGEDTVFLLKLLSGGIRVGVSRDAFYTHYIQKRSASKKEADPIRDLELFYQSLTDRSDGKEISEEYAADCLIVNLIVLINYFIFVPGTGFKTRRTMLAEIAENPTVKTALEKYSKDFPARYKLIAFLLKNGRYDILQLVFLAYQTINK